MTTIDEQITCVKREIARRGSAYPGAVRRKSMSQVRADREIATMQAVLATLERVKTTWDPPPAIRGDVTEPMPVTTTRVEWPFARGEW